MPLLGIFFFVIVAMAWLSLLEGYLWGFHTVNGNLLG